MAKGFSANMSEGSFTKAITKISKLANEKSKEIDMELGAYVEDLATMARQKAPGKLSQRIAAVKVRPFSYELQANTNYAAYVEFGTGKYFLEYKGVLTKFWNKLAYGFYVNGKGTTRPQPFFFPTVMTLRPIFLEKLKNLLKK